MPSTRWHDSWPTDPPGDVVELVGTQEWRLRVGDWRVRFGRAREAQAVVVLHVLPGGRAYGDR